MKKYNEKRITESYDIASWAADFRRLDKEHDDIEINKVGDEFYVSFEDDSIFMEDDYDGAMFTITSQDDWESAYVSLRNIKRNCEKIVTRRLPDQEFPEQGSADGIMNDVMTAIRRLRKM